MNNDAIHDDDNKLPEEAALPMQEPVVVPQEEASVPDSHELAAPEAVEQPVDPEEIAEPVPAEAEQVQQPVDQEEGTSPELSAAQDEPAPVEPAPVASPASAGPALRALPTTLTAAADAAAFVARIFAEDAPPAEPAATAAAESEDAASAEDAPLVDNPAAQPQPAQWTPLLQDQHILILGLGASGLAMARWCARQGAAQITVADTREAPPQLATLQAELPNVRFVSGPFTSDMVDGQGLHAVYRSPGLSPQTTAPVLDAARAIGLVVGGELTLYAQALQGLRTVHGYAPAVLAITGTNGKTTVTSLTGQLMAHAGKTVAVAGNIGPTLLDTLTQGIDSEAVPHVWVLELSSFQLDGETSFEPTAAVVLNVTQDHLDWHGNMQSYAAAKARIFGKQGLLVLNRDDATVMAMLPEPIRAKLQKPQWRNHVTFGSDMPQRPGDFGLEDVNGMVWLVRALEADETLKKRRDTEDELHIQRLMPADALRIRGRHNASNALAALALSAAAGCPLAPILYGLREYRGEPHRVEPIGILNGVEFFDDSKGTNVGATVAALKGLGEDRRVVVVLGGDGKGQDFAPLAEPVARYARAVVLIGRDAPQIRAALEGTGVTVVDATSMDDAVQQANTKAHAGDAVLMSPACASFDMFDNYEHRARVFGDAVRALALAAGTELEASR